MDSTDIGKGLRLAITKTAQTVALYGSVIFCPKEFLELGGYDSRTQTRSYRDYLTAKKLYNHDRELVFDLGGVLRENGTHQRPIIFIARSIGGMVVKNVSSMSSSTTKSAVKERSAFYS